MARMTFISFAGIVSMGVIALAGCGSSSGTVGPFAGVGTTGSAAAIGGHSAAVPPAATGTSIGAASGSMAGGGGWVLSAPNSVFGFPQIQPSAAVLAHIQSQLAKGAAPLGVSGAQVIAVYDDRPHGLYLIFAGYNGSGFDPARMQAAYQTAPVTTEDATGDTMVINNLTIDPGPHGGTAGCNSVMEQTAVATTEATLCSWMTTTTMGSVSTYPNPEHPNVTAVGPDVMGKTMRDLRDQFEYRS